MPTGFEIAQFQFENAKGSLILGGKITDKYRVISFSGLNGLPFQFNSTRNADAQSVYLESTLAQPRLITFVFEVDNIPEERELLMQFFNPLITENRLVANWNGNIRYIDYVPYPILIEQSTTYSKMKCTVDLYCPKPFWIDPDSVVPSNIESNTIALPITKDEPTRYLHTVYFTIVNNGDVPMPFKVNFTNDGASICTDPKVQLIYNYGDEPYMQAHADVWWDDIDLVGSEVEFSTYPNDLYVKRISWQGEEDLENTLDINHEYFMIPIGNHTIQCSVETNDSLSISIDLYGSARYLGL